MLKLVKILKSFEIKNKLFEIVINKANNNDTLKNYYNITSISALAISSKKFPYQMRKSRLDATLCI